MRGFLQPWFAIQAIYFAPQLDDPVVTLGTGTFTGTNVGRVSKFLGIPFAEAPRFANPEAITAYVGAHDAKAYGPSCPKQFVPLPEPDEDEGSGQAMAAMTSPDPRNTYKDAHPENEDCLTVNVIRPIDTTSTDGLPVVVFIHGGGFLIGSSFEFDEHGVRLVERSVDFEMPIIYVSLNYRLSAYGFIASSEVKHAGAGNIGLKDQRLALHWVQTFIAQFGGDPSKVTLWGQSAGAISASMHMIAYDGRDDDLFRAGFMQSGAPIPVGDISQGQPFYDQLVIDAGCSGSTDSLTCLRQIPFDTLKEAVDKSPNFLDPQALVLPWSPRVDGEFLTEKPFKLIEEHKVLDIPIVSGNCDDEGTIFSLKLSTTVNTDAKFRAWIKQYWTPNASEEELLPLWTKYPTNVLLGSPFDSLIGNLLGQYKRIAAFQGDIVFQGPRRYFLGHLASYNQNKIWSFLSKRFKTTKYLGSFHGSDLDHDILQDYIVRFVNNLDPNNGTGLTWPVYSLPAKSMYTFPPSGDAKVEPDTYRADRIQYLINLARDNPL